jgi:hypothetical protein
MLGQSINMMLPQVIGYRIKGKLSDLCTSTDVVLTITKVKNNFFLYFIQTANQNTNNKNVTFIK